VEFLQEHILSYEIHSYVREPAEVKEILIFSAKPIMYEEALCTPLAPLEALVDKIY
jgi:hypothetical protein